MIAVKSRNNSQVSVAEPEKIEIKFLYLLQTTLWSNDEYLANPLKLWMFGRLIVLWETEQIKFLFGSYFVSIFRPVKLSNRFNLTLAGYWTFYLEKCVPNGIRTWEHLNKMPWR